MTLRVLVAGLGNMGRSHALAYALSPDFEIVGLVNRSQVDLPPELAGHAITPDFPEALARLKPDLVCIATYSDTHADYAVAALEAGAHVFVEKPLATTVADALRVGRGAPAGRSSSATSSATTRAGSASSRSRVPLAALMSSASTSTSKAAAPPGRCTSA
jgi:predicted dehydrogenase